MTLSPRPDGQGPRQIVRRVLPGTPKVRNDNARAPLREPGRSYLTLDNQPTLAAARSDPVAFIRNLDRAVTDEVQRAPDLLPAIKHSVDEDQRPGRFLLTGSANLLTIKTIHESLAGRVEVVPLYPLSCNEQLRIKRPQFLARTFRGEVPRGD